MKNVIGWNLGQVRKQELEEMVDAMEGLSDVDCTTLLSMKAAALGFHKIVRENNVKNDIFLNEGGELALVIIQDCHHTLINIPLMELIGEKCICSRYTKRKDEPNRVRKPSIWINGKMVSIYHLLFPESSKDDQYDHKAMSRAINTSDFVRKCTSAENKSNKKYRSKIIRLKSGFRFETRCQREDFNSVPFYEEEKNEYKIERVPENSRIDVRSPFFSDEDEMYRHINHMEKKLFGDFRYAPLLACETASDEMLLLKWQFFGTLTEEEYKYAKLYALKKRPDPKGYDIVKYYGLEQEVQ